MENASSETLKKIEQEYERTFILPVNKLSPQWVLMPVGLIGAGKTTVVKPLAEHFGLIRLCTDDVRKLLKERGYSYEGCRDIIQALLRKYLALGYSLALDANTGSTHALPYNERTMADFPHVRFVFIHIDPPEQYIVDKLKKYQHTWLFKDSEQALANYFANKQAFTIPNLPFAYTFDPSGSDFSQQLRDGTEAIDKMLKEASK